MNQSTDNRVTQAALARALGVTRQAVHDLIRRGVLAPDAEGRFDVDHSRQRIAERVRPSGKAASAAAAALGTDAPAPPAEDQPGDDNPQSNQSAYYVAKALREAAEASMAQLKLAEMQRKLIQAEPTLSAIYSAFRPLRDQCMLAGRKVAPTVSSMTDRREIQVFVERAMAEIFDVYVKTTLPKLVAAINGVPRDLPPDVAAAAQAPADEGAAP